jgi:hypothetical protein
MALRAYSSSTRSRAFCGSEASEMSLLSVLSSTDLAKDIVIVSSAIEWANEEPKSLKPKPDIPPLDEKGPKSLPFLLVFGFFLCCSVARYTFFSPAGNRPGG